MRPEKLLCVAAVFMLCLPGLVVLPEDSEAAPPAAQYVLGDITIGTGYTYSTYVFSGVDAFYMVGNITVRAGGKLLVKDTTLAFTQAYNNNASKGPLVNRVFTLTVEDGGMAIFENATLTTHLISFCAFPSLGMVARTKATVYANDSLLAFPGHILFDNATVSMKNTRFTAGTENVATYCDQKLFPASLFSSPAVIYQASSTVELTNCTMDPFASVPQLVDGPHIIMVQATDMDGLVGQQSITVIANAGGTAVIPPQVEITTPLNDVVLAGTVPVIARVTPGSSMIVGVQFLIDGMVNTTMTNPPYQFNLDTTSLSDGNHDITVQAQDFGGQVGGQTIAVTANNGGGAILGPQVQIASPKNDAIVVGPTTVNVNVNEASAAIRWVEFFVDGQRQSTLFTPPYTFTLNTPSSGTSGVYVYSYPFLQDTQERNHVYYKLERDLNRTMLINIAGQSSGNLVRNDTLFYTVAAGQQFRTALFDVMPLTFDRSAVESITLKVLYKTNQFFNDLGTPDRVQIVPWLSVAPQDTDITITRTSPVYDTSLIYEAQKSYTLSPMSSTELRQLSVSYANTKADSVLFNRIWLEVKLKASSYGKLNATGGNQLTIINSTLPLNMDSGSYGKMVLTQASSAYLYNVSLDAQPTSGGNPPYWPGVSFKNAYTPISVQPSRKSSADTTGQSLANLIYQSGASYVVGQGLTMSLDRFDMPWIKSGQITSVRLSVTYTTAVGYSGGNYITYKMAGGTVKNTGILPVASLTPRTVTYDLSAVGVDTFDDIRNLTIAFTNGALQSVNFSRLVLEVQYDPSFYVYRMAEMSVSDSAGDPVQGAVISSYEFQSSPAMVYMTPNGVASAPPAAVLNYLGRAAGDFATTDYLGLAKVPLLTDIADATSAPNAISLPAYRLRVDITNHTGVHYSATTAAGFAPYPDILPEEMTRTFRVTIANFICDKALLMAYNLVLSPYPIYEGQTATLSFRLENFGTATAYNILVVMADRYDMFNSTFNVQTLASLAPGAGVTISGAYQAPALAGLHVLSACVDPYNEVRELNDTSERYLKIDIRVGSLATLQLVPNGLQINPTRPTVNITATISVMIQKEGDQPSAPKLLVVLVQYEDGSRDWLNVTVPSLPSGSQTYYAIMEWTPTQMGAYDVTAAMRGVGEEKVSTTVLNYCDLVADSLRFYVNLRPTQVAHIGDLVVMEVIISNHGESSANNFLVRFWLGTIQDGIILEDVHISQLSSGQVTVAAIDWTAIVREGERYTNWTITVEVNPFSHPYDHPINETTYANNVVAGVLEVVDDRPYLMITDVSVLVSGSPAQVAVYGQTMAVSFSLKNNGSGPSKSTQVAVYLLAPNGTAYYYYQATVDLVSGGSMRITTPTAPVKQPIATYSLVVRALSPVQMIGYNGSAWYSEVFDVTTLVNPTVTINTFGKTDYKPGDGIVAIVTITTSSGSPLVGLPATAVLLDSEGNQLGNTYSYVTNDGGGFTALLGIPQTYNGPATVKIDISAGSQTISRSLSINVGTPAATGLPTWVIIVIVIAIIAAAIFLVWKFYLRKGGKEMIECGECGSLIPGDSKKCPNCGVEFELSKVRCSNCGAYIDQNLDECPECGARFSKRVEQPTVDEADKELRAEYDEFINQIRLQAKAALGDKFTEEKLAEWLKTEPEYLPYDQWVVRKKEREAASTAKPCAQCGTLNPATATVCSKCGSQISGEQKEAPKARTFRRIVRRSDKKEEGEEKPEAKEEEGKK